MTREEKIKVLIHELTYPYKDEEFVLLCSGASSEPGSMRSLSTHKGDFTRETVAKFHSMHNESRENE